MRIKVSSGLLHCWILGESITAISIFEAEFRTAYKTRYNLLQWHFHYNNNNGGLVVIIYSFQTLLFNVNLFASYFVKTNFGFFFVRKEYGNETNVK